MQSVASGPPRVRRMQLSPERQAELYEVVMQLLREVGYEALTMPAVAARARCSTATLYRLWNGKPGLVVAALRHHQPEPQVDADTGTLRGDLRAVVSQIIRAAPADHELMAGLAHAALRDPDLAEVIHEQVDGPIGALLNQALDRAVARGEISPDTPARAFCQHVMLAIVQVRPMLEGQEANESRLLSFVDAVLLPALAHSAPVQPPDLT